MIRFLRTHRFAFSPMIADMRYEYVSDRGEILMGFIKGFTPNWFTVGMGTGILALDAYSLPIGPSWLKLVGMGLGMLNVVIVTVLLVLAILKVVYDRSGVRDIFHHPIQSMFLGAIPMAITTVVNAVFVMGARYDAVAAYHLGAIFWTINVLIALASGFAVPFWMFTRHDHALSRMSAVWLMPIVPAEVVAASGAILLPHVASLALRQDLLVGITVLWAFSVPMAFLMLGVLFVRLALHNLPPEDLAISTWITLGTLGTGVMGLIGIGHDVGFAFAQFSAGVQAASLLLAVILWGLGLWWMGQSIFITLFYLVTGRLRFNLGWWGLTFPLGVFASGTDLLYGELKTPIFLWSAWIFFGLLAVFWVIVAGFTVWHHGLWGRTGKGSQEEREAAKREAS